MDSSILLISLPAALLLHATSNSSDFKVPFPVPKLSLFTSIFIVFPILHLSLASIIYSISIRRRANKLGSILPPQVKGWLPGNLDISAMLFKRLNEGQPPGRVWGELLEEYGTVYMVPTIGNPIILTGDPHLMPHILTKNFKNYGKPLTLTTAMDDLCGNGIFASDQRSLWSYHRQLTRPHFTKDENFNLPRMLHYSDRFVDYFVRKSKKGEPVEVQDIFGRFTMDAGTEMFFGVSVGSLQDLEALDNGESPPNNSDEFVNAFLEAQISIQQRVRDTAQFWKIKERFHNPNDQRMKIIAPRMQKIIDDAIASKAKGTEERRVLLNSLLDDTQDRKLLQDELLNILLAARDTTAFTLSAILLELSKRPDVVAKLRSEIKQTLNDDACRAPENDDVKKMKYLRAVINETLRFWPPVILTSRSAFEDDVWTSDNTRYFIPKGATVRLLTAQIHRSTKWWGPDAGQWDPERWVDDRLKYVTSNPSIYAPFGSGPRICLGQNLALSIASFALVRLLQKVSSVSLAKDVQPKILPNDDVAKSQGLILTFHDGLWMRFETEDLEKEKI